MPTKHALAIAGVTSLIAHDMYLAAKKFRRQQKIHNGEIINVSTFTVNGHTHIGEIDLTKQNAIFN